MTINEALTIANTKLVQAGINTARLDSLVLLEDVTGQDRAWLLANPQHKITPGQMTKLKKLLNRRAAHEPLAYLRGRAEFYTRDFVITRAVLQPRPESETMIDCLKKLARNRPGWRIADVGAGSGALGITAALELPNSQVDLLEIDSKAIKVAKMNVDKFTLSINVIRSDLLSAAKGRYDILLCNLPYVPDNFHINLAAGHEPRLAIFGGPDGLEVYRRLFSQINELDSRPLYILCESLPSQHSALDRIAQTVGYHLSFTEDLIQVFTRE